MRYLLLGLALLVGGCGAQAAAPASVIASSGQFRSEASPARLAAGGTVHVTLTVSGPIDYEVGCVQTLHIWAVDSQGTQVWAEPVPAIMCMALGRKSLPAGETATFTADWPTASTLKVGAYSIHGLFLTVLPIGAGTRVRENLPPLTVQLTA
jgi:hypothetical protein